MTGASDFWWGNYLEKALKQESRDRGRDGKKILLTFFKFNFLTKLINIGIFFYKK